MLTIFVPNLNFEYNGTFEKSIRSTEKKIHILGEGLYWFYDNRSIVQNSIIYFLQTTGWAKRLMRLPYPDEFLTYKKTGCRLQSKYGLLCLPLHWACRKIINYLRQHNALCKTKEGTWYYS